jgi:hypothetical protein
MRRRVTDLAMQMMRVRSVSLEEREMGDFLCEYLSTRCLLGAVCAPALTAQARVQGLDRLQADGSCCREHIRRPI